MNGWMLVVRQRVMSDMSRVTNSAGATLLRRRPRAVVTFCRPSLDCGNIRMFLVERSVKENLDIVIPLHFLWYS